MAGGFDLYGTYYPRETDAINAETAQCAAIDAELALRKANASESTLYGLCEANHYEIMELRERVVALEKIIADRIAAVETEDPEPASLCPQCGAPRAEGVGKCGEPCL